MLPPSRTPGPPPTRAKPSDPDSSIRQTDSDAAIAKLSATNKQYLVDPFIRLLVPRPHTQPSRPPVINHGTHVRTVAVDMLLDQWLEISKAQNTQCQVVNLGCGSDTRFWRLATSPMKDTVARYIEVDFPEITTKKAMSIRKSKELSAPLGPSENVKLTHGGTGLQSLIYNLLPCDLRKPPAETFSSLTEGHEPLLRPDLPTLLLFECVLVYMKADASTALLEWFRDYFQSKAPLGCVVYEMFGLGDQFGKVLIDNLQLRNVHLPGAAAFPTKGSLPKRFLDISFSAAHALTLKDIRLFCIDSKEIRRISQLEMLDEIEELDLILDHYAVTWGLNLPTSLGGSRWSSWQIKRRTEPEDEDTD